MHIGLLHTKSKQYMNVNIVTSIKSVLKSAIVRNTICPMKHSNIRESLLLTKQIGLQWKKKRMIWGVWVYNFKANDFYFYAALYLLVYNSDLLLFLLLSCHYKCLSCGAMTWPFPIQGPEFKTSGWLQGRLTLSSFRGRSNEYKEFLGI